MTEHVASFDGTEGYVLKKGGEEIQANKRVMSLRSAIARATGISSGSAHTIGRLLIADVEGVSVLDLLNPRFNPDTVVDGVHALKKYGKTFGLMKPSKIANLRP